MTWLQLISNSGLENVGRTISKAIGPWEQFLLGSIKLVLRTATARFLMFKPGAEEDDWKASYYIAITREGYWIQSQVLQVPDHLGFFDQVDEPFRWALGTDIVMWLCVHRLFEVANSVESRVNILGDVVIVWLLLFGGFGRSRLVDAGCSRMLRTKKMCHR